MRVAIVGGSSGIGRATAETFAPMSQVITLQRGECDIGYSYLLDLRWPKHLIEVGVGHVEKDFDYVDALIISGGTAGYSYPTCVEERVEETFRTNVLGPRYVFNAMLPLLKNAPDGARVLYISSTVHETVPNGLEDYAASKIAGETLFRSFGRRYARWGIRSNVLRLGWVETPMTENLKKEKAERARGATALKRFATVDEAAQSIYHAVMSMPDYMTGDVLRISGGLS